MLGSAIAAHRAAQASLDADFSKSALSMLTNSTTGSVVIVVSENETIFRRVISMLVLSAVAFPLNRVVALLACDEQFVYNLMTSGQAVPAGLGLILASSLPKWWKGNALLHRRLEAALQTQQRHPGLEHLGLALVQPRRNRQL